MKTLAVLVGILLTAACDWPVATPPYAFQLVRPQCAERWCSWLPMALWETVSTHTTFIECYRLTPAGQGYIAETFRRDLRASKFAPEIDAKVADTFRWTYSECVPLR